MIKKVWLIHLEFQKFNMKSIDKLLNKYELIIIDEGISNIDEKDERKILEYLKECYNSGETNIIFVSHKSTYDQIFKQTVNLDNHDKN